MSSGLCCEATERDAIELLLKALDVVRVAMTKTADRDACDEIEIFIAIDVDYRTALGAVDDNLRIERDRLQPRPDHLGLAIENRLRSRARHYPLFHTNG